VYEYDRTWEDGKELKFTGDITHGGLSLQETPAWVEARKVVEAESRYKVVQQHRDELSSEVCKRPCMAHMY
jgi:hypothetical protein